MPRGPHPQDHRLFDKKIIPTLRDAVADLSWLLSRHYNASSALTLVGNRFQLTQRQRQAVRRSSCSDQSLQKRIGNKQPLQSIQNQVVMIDGFNLLIGIENALNGGLLLRGRDGVFRDLAGIHGSYRLISQTPLAIRMVHQALESLQARSWVWILDRPVSNSGKLSQAIRHEQGTVHLVHNPDQEIIAKADVAISSDAQVIENSATWFPLLGHIIHNHIPQAWIVSLRTPNTPH